MPTEQSAPSEGVDSALAADQGVTIPRISLSEQGLVGLKISNKQILEEANRAFRYPAFLKTVNEMRNNPTVGTAINVYRMMISRKKWFVKPPTGSSAKEIARAKAIESMMKDMSHSWEDFISEIVSYVEFGFDVHEIVLRRRLKRNGSKYNDGLIGIKKLAPRSQDTVTGWIFDKSGDELLQIEQSINLLEDQYKLIRTTNQDGKIAIDRDKVLLFVCNPTKGNPQGNSIYKNIYLAFKQLTLLQEQQLVGVAKSIQGTLKFEIPPKYLSPDASAEDKATYAAFISIIDNYNAGTQRGFILPRIVDPETKLNLFDYGLMEDKSATPYNLESIIRGLQNDILTALSVDVLRLGADGSGSFALAESKTSILTLAIDARLREIASTLNHQLMPLLYKMNGWEAENLPEFAYDVDDDLDLDSFSSAIQRICAVNALEMDREAMNKIREMLGLDSKPEDEPVNKEELSSAISEVKSRSGDGMAVGTNGGGTSKSPIGKGDNSVSNKENS